MKILFISEEMIGGDLAYTLKQEGCDVRLFIVEDGMKDCLNGMVAKTDDWRQELEWVGKDGLIIFDDVGYGEIQDKLRAEGYSVVGGSGGGDRLELDRIYGQQILEASGVVNAGFETMTMSLQEAIDFVKKNGGEWVVKQNDHNTALNYVGSMEDGSDVIDMLEGYKNRFGDSYSISLQRRVRGVEIAIGRFFNGKDWVGPSVINFEHKHLCNEDIGPLGGETGTLMWFEKDENSKLFQRTLSGLKSHLIEINYRGYIDVNCIVDHDTIYPLELTSRFGSSTIETQEELNISPWKEFFSAVARGEEYDLEYKEEYALNVALTVPPFPYRTSDKNICSDNVNVFLKKELTLDDLSHIHFEGVMLRKVNEKEIYYTAGNLGYVMYVTGSGKTIEEARKKVYQIISKVVIPKMFYRTDIGLRFIEKDQKLLKDWGWI